MNQKEFNAEPNKSDYILNNFIEILHQISKHLAVYLKDKFTILYGKNYWPSLGKDVFVTEDENRHRNELHSLMDLDFYGLIKIFNRQFRSLSQHKLVHWEKQSIVKQMYEVRNKIIGHKKVSGIDLDDIEKFLIYTKELCLLIEAPNHILTRLSDLKDQASLLNLENKGILPESGYATSTENEIKQTGKIQNTISMSKFLKEGEFTKSQESALLELEKFLNSKEDQCFILNGYAGTGKTFLIGKLIKYLNLTRRKAVLMAPTGRAARVLTEQHGIHAATIHKTIYYIKELREYQDIDSEGNVTYKYYFALLNNEYEHGSVFIIDEASMVDDVYTEQEFIRFGSGKLLTDLMQYIGFDNNDNLKKVIFVGDNAQLPPIGMNFSPALNSEYLKNTFGLSIKFAKLTEVVRQVENSTILRNATAIRENLDKGQLNYFTFECDNVSVFQVSQSEFKDLFLKEYRSKNTDQCIIITYSNSLAASYNKDIRAELFPGKESICIGDRIIAVKNSYNYLIEIMNGQICHVVDVDPIPEIRNVPLNIGTKVDGGKEVIAVPLKFRNISIKVQDSNKKDHIIKVKILENLLYTNHANLSSHESKALYVDFKLRNPNLKVRTEEFKRTIKNDPYFNALQVKFAYAITGHKSQGGEWSTVFVDFEGRNTLTEDNLHWNYTAITRAKKILYVTNVIHHSLLNPINMNHSDLIPIEEIEQDKHTIKIDESIQVPEKLAEASEQTKYVFKLKRPHLPDNLIFESAEQRPFQEHFIVNFEGKTFRIIVSYKKNKKITNVNFNKRIPGFPVEAFEITKKIINTEIKVTETLDGENKNNMLPENDLNFQFFMHANKLYEENGYNFNTINKLSDYHYKALIYSKESNLALNYYFDGKRRFKSLRPIEQDFDKVLFNKILTLHLEA